MRWFAVLFLLGCKAPSVIDRASVDALCPIGDMSMRHFGGVTLVSIAVTPATFLLFAGRSTQLTAIGTYSDASTLNLTSAVEWSSSDETVGTVTSGTDGGVVTGGSAGSSTISATLGTISGTADLSIPSKLKITGKKILPLGDSITVGYGPSGDPSELGGYRDSLWNDYFVPAGVTPQLVGLNVAGPSTLPVLQRHHDGVGGSHVGPGPTASYWFEGANIAVYMNDASGDANAMLLHIGTNDVDDSFELSTFGSKLGTLLDEIHAIRPSMIVLVAQIIPLLDPVKNLGAIQINAQIPAVVQARSSYCLLVDQYTGFNTATMLSDSCHPNLLGYQQMAAVWWSALGNVYDLTP